MTARISLLSYGVGNIRSVHRALTHVGAQVEAVTTPAEVLAADKLVLPGVGAFSHCAQTLRDRGLWDPILSVLASDRAFLGICVGMQLMLEASEEFGTHDGFGFIPGRVQRLPDVSGQKIPMVGWKPVTAAPGAPFLPPTASYYFVHSFAARPTTPTDRLASYAYGPDSVTAAVGRGNKIGTQFHPEKSGEAGLDRFLIDVAGSSTSITGFSCDAPQVEAHGTLSVVSTPLVIDVPLTQLASHSSLAVFADAGLDDAAGANGAMHFDFSELLALPANAPPPVAASDRVVAEDALVALAADDTFMLAEDYGQVAQASTAYDPYGVGMDMAGAFDGAQADPVLSGEIAAFAPSADSAADPATGSSPLALQDFAFNDFIA